MSRPAPRRPASSSGRPQRPRKIAGQGQSGRQAGQDAAPATEAAAEKPPSKPTAVKVEVSTLSSAPRRNGLLARPKTTRVLIASLVLVTIALVLELAIFAVDALTDEEIPPATDDTSVLVPAGRPVVANELAVLGGVDAAARAAQELFSVDYAKYDEELANAVKLTTERYEKDYRTTIADVREEAVAQKVVVNTSVVGQGIVRANLTRLDALIFANQTVQRVRDGEPETVVTPIKMLVTMVHTDQGWLVDNLDTDQQEDNSN